MGNSEDKRIVKLTPAYDSALAELIRENLKKNALDIPGTVYYDDNLNHLSDYYLADSQKRYYCIVLDEEEELIGGIGLAECDFLRIAVNFRSSILQTVSKAQDLAIIL